MEKRYKPGEFAKLVNRTVGTLRKWDRDGKLVAERMPSGHRYYTSEHLAEALNIERKQPQTYNIIYARVSSAKQKTDLERQVSALIVSINRGGDARWQKRNLNSIGTQR